MKIDLHCHTKKVKKGDNEKRNVSLEVFKQKISDADVKIVAITNHNLFDLEQYNIYTEAVSDYCKLWPGIEIDIQEENSSRYHLIVIANPENAEEFSSITKELFDGQDLDTYTLNCKEVYEKLNACDVIYIPHYHKKPGISESDLIKLKTVVNDDSRIFYEPSDHRSLGVFANYNYSVMIGSDVQDWSKYEKSTFADLRLPVETFSQFCMMSKRDNVVINTLLNKKVSYQMIASPHSSVKLNLKIYEDVNIIFGQKGTGKSEILNSLYTSMLSKGKSCEKYIGTEKDYEFKKVLKNKDMEADLSLLGIEDCADDFKAISMWTDTNPTQFSNYINWYETKDNNRNKRRMKITEASKLIENKPKQYDIHEKDKKTIKQILKHFSDIDISMYLNAEKYEQLLLLFKELTDKVFEEFKNDVISKCSCELTNYSIENIKNIADKNSNTISKPSSTGFGEFALKRVKLCKIIKNIINAFLVGSFNEREYIGELEEKGKIYINKRYRMLCDESRTEEFSKGIQKLKQIKKQLYLVLNHIYSDGLNDCLSELKTMIDEESVENLKPFLGLSKQVVTEDGQEYSPSNGEKGILLLQNILNKEADAYFLDEPELGMGNSYIDQNIRPIISGLAKRRKVVVIATHNANIAVRTLPYMTIFREHKNGIYTTYVGNPFNDILQNIDDENDYRSWTTESLHTLEGGEEAFYERKNIYESKAD